MDDPAQVASVAAMMDDTRQEHDMDILDEVRFWTQVMTDSERTVFCSPEMESRVKGWVDARGMGGVITVMADRACPDDRVYVIDHRAMDAMTAKALQRPIKIFR